MHPGTAAQEPIVAAAASDAAFLPLTLVVAKSIAATSTTGRPVVLHVLYDGPDSPMVERIRRWRDPIVEVRLIRHANPWADVSGLKRLPPSTLHRAAIPDVLKEHGRAIYLDLDLVVNADLSALFDTDLEGHALGGVVDFPLVNGLLQDTEGARRKRAYLSDILGLDTAERRARYVQGGVALLDLEQLRRIGFAQRFDTFVRRHPSVLLYADQCATNAILRDDIMLLAPSWNVLAKSQRPGVFERAHPSLHEAYGAQRAVASIVHFAGTKPWRSRTVPYGRLWWRYAFQTGIWPAYVPGWIAGVAGASSAGITRWRDRRRKRRAVT